MAFTLTDPTLPAAIDAWATRGPDDDTDTTAPHRYRRDCMCDACLQCADAEGE